METVAATITLQVMNPITSLLSHDVAIKGIHITWSFQINLVPTDLDYRHCILF